MGPVDCLNVTAIITSLYLSGWSLIFPLQHPNQGLLLSKPPFATITVVSKSCGPSTGILMYLSKDNTSSFSDIHRAAYTKQEVWELFLGRADVCLAKHTQLRPSHLLSCLQAVWDVSEPDRSHIWQCHSCFCIMLHLLQFAGSIWTLNLIRSIMFHFYWEALTHHSFPFSSCLHSRLPIAKASECLIISLKFGWQVSSKS